MYMASRIRFNGGEGLQYDKLYIWFGGIEASGCGLESSRWSLNSK